MTQAISVKWVEMILTFRHSKWISLQATQQQRRPLSFHSCSSINMYNRNVLSQYTYIDNYRSKSNSKDILIFNVTWLQTQKAHYKLIQTDSFRFCMVKTLSEQNISNGHLSHNCLLLTIFGDSSSFILLLLFFVSFIFNGKNQTNNNRIE